MSMNEKKHVSIIGSCISRDVFGFNQDSGYQIDRFVQSISPISGGTDRVSDIDYQRTINDIMGEYEISNFYKRNFALDLTGKTFDYLFEADSDYLLIDMATCRYDLLKNACGGVMTGISSLHHAEITSAFCRKYHVPEFTKVIDRDEDIIWMMDRYVPRYLNRILSKYDPEYIILLEAYAVPYYLLENAALAEYANKELTDSWNVRIRHGYELACSHLDGCHIIRFPSCVLGDAKHKWGLDKLHYRPEYYEYAFQAVNAIAEKSPKEEERKKLDVLYDTYSRKFEIFFKESLSNTLRKKNNIESENKRLWKYNFYFQDLLLHEEKLERLANHLRNSGCHSCAFYGISQITVFLIEYLPRLEIAVNYVVENRSEKTWKGIPCYDRNLSDYPEADIIIIADALNYDTIREKLKGRTDIPVTDVYELVG